MTDYCRKNKKELKEIISISSLHKDLKKVLADFHQYNDFILKSTKNKYYKINIFAC